MAQLCSCSTSHVSWEPWAWHCGWLQTKLTCVEVESGQMALA
jgi:hypothetical protein